MSYFFTCRFALVCAIIFMKMTAPSTSDQCTPSGEDTFQTGSHIPCCEGCTEDMEFVEGDYHYICIGTCDSSCTPNSENTFRTGVYVPCCEGCSETNVHACQCSLTPPYKNNYPTIDNAFGAPLSSDGARNKSFAFILADHGLAAGSTYGGECCQTLVANAMLTKRRELEAQGATLAFIGAGGDNFYWTGLNTAANGGNDQWTRWENVYTGLTDVPWLGE